MKLRYDDFHLFTWQYWVIIYGLLKSEITGRGTIVHWGPTVNVWNGNTGSKYFLMISTISYQNQVLWDAGYRVGGLGKFLNNYVQYYVFE